MNRGSLKALGGLLVATAAGAQDKPTDDTLETIVVVGSHIDGARTSAALPVSVINADQIAATGAVTGDDLMRTIPQMGNVTFNATNDQQTSNAARGDVASIDLRGAGLGHTLVLLNGRRIVEHPTSQSRGGVPILSYNAQSLPTAGLQRVEILRQGAAAIYGSDAVAGVINAVTRSDVDGLSANIQYGWAEGTQREEPTASLIAGRDFLDSRGNVTLSVSAMHRAAQLPSDEPYTATQDLRPFFADDPGFAGNATADGRGNQSSFPALVARTASGGTRSSAILQGATALTTAAGSFHVQPDTVSGCATAIGNGLCLARGTVPYGTTANALRYDSRALDAVTIAPEIDRQNVSLNAHFDLGDAHTLYSQLDYYRSRSHALSTQPATLVPFGVPASNYYNPFGASTFANGAVNPNRVAGLTNVPAAGLPVTFATYRFNDLGPNRVDVASFQDRFLVGAKGRLGGFDYDSALLYGEAHVTDESDAIDSSLLAAQLALSTPDAYDPFNGGCLDGSGGQDCTPSSQAALDAIGFRLKRASTNTLINVDFKMSRSDLLSLRTGDVGLALGVEGRRETHTDVRDPHINGEIPFTDPVLQTVAPSSAVGVNNTPSTSDSRTVVSLFTELAIPVTRTLNAQLAGRLEHYSDFGNVFRPKAALAWNAIEGLKLRATWEKGFKAPNLETTAAYTYGRAQTVTDWYRCQAALNTGRITSFNACNQNFGISYRESGNPDLDPETSESYDVGFVLKPAFIPDSWGRFTLSLDRWRLRQSGIVGVVGFDTVAVEDYLDRNTGGAGSANLERAEATADDIAFYSGSGLAAVGAPVIVNDQFKNLEPKSIAGFDLGLAWNKLSTKFGSFEATLEATRLDEYAQPPSAELQRLYDARDAGLIDAATPLENPGNQLRVLGNPEWKGIATSTWSRAGLQIGASVIYTGSTLDTNFLADDGAAWRVASLTTVNLYGAMDLKRSGAMERVRIKVGARNLLDRSPPLQSDGFNGALFQPYGRYLYVNLGMTL